MREDPGGLTLTALLPSPSQSNMVFKLERRLNYNTVGKALILALLREFRGPVGPESYVKLKSLPKILCAMA